MRAIIRTSSTTGFVALSLVILLPYIFSIQQAVGSKADDKVLRKWKPVAVDEGLFVKKDVPGDSAISDYSRKGNSPFGITDDAKISHRIPETIEETPLFGDKSYNAKTVNLMDEALAMDERQRANHMEDSPYIPLPDVPTRELTRLITSRGSDAPTFLMDEIIQPSLGMTGERNKNGDEILASYSLMIPVFIPAIKSKAFFTTTKPEPVKFVKETVTEMVPITRTVPHVKEVIKAEKVPHELITDYVTTRSRTIPPRVNDAILPGERIVTSTMTLLD